MNIASLIHTRPASALGRLFGTAGMVFAIGLLNPPAVQMAVAVAAATPVAVDQQPLTVRPQIPPDIVLMLDDSGSMAWDVMPDYNYLGANQGSPTGDELRSSDVNGVYYDPTTVYSPPYQANGTLNPQATFTAAWINGFSQSQGTVDLTTYNGSSDSSRQDQYGNALPSDIPYSQSFTITTSGTPYPPTNCPGGYALQASQCVKQPTPATCPVNSTLITTSTDPNYGTCRSGAGTRRNPYQYTPSCSTGNTFSNPPPLCTPNPPVTRSPSCNAGDGTPNASGLCVPQGTTATYSFFVYTVQNTNGTYTKHYVGLSGTCALAQLTSNCEDTAAKQQNVANWYAYYHTRILMAKSGLMNAFNSIDRSFRVGFGSIDGNNLTALGSNPYTFTTSVPGGYSYPTGISPVAPFGSPTDASSQRLNFWNWIIGESAGGGTPLRQALDYVGQYYQTSQPWQTMSSDPVASTTPPLACRQAYTILTTDGFWNDSFTGVGNADNTNGSTITGPNNPAGLAYTAAPPFSDSNSDTLADVAMKYWKTDLQSGIANEVPTSSADPAFWQHMTTFTMGLGFAPTGITGTAPNGHNPPTIDEIFAYASGKAGTTITGFGWPTPSSNSLNNIADLAHAAVNGHGAFYSATNANAFANGILSALRRATERVGTGASLAANSTQLRTGTAVFQANYYTAAWKGDLKELAVDPNTGAIASAVTWSAAAVMPAASSRAIKTYNTTTGAFVDFQNSSGLPPTLSTTQLNALGATTAAQVAMVDYLRGNASNEQTNGGNFRSRDTALGDIVNSQPVYVGAPNVNEFVGRSFAGYPNDPNNASATPFQDWAVGTTDASGNFTASAASSRTPLVYVAANDGMLHAFNSSTGVETFAYLPGSLLINATDPYLNTPTPLTNLSDPNYGTNTIPHTYFNDGELTVADAYVKLSGDTTATWHTLLVGTTGRGPARAVYALDVTDPAHITPLWERYASDGNALDANSGYIGQMVGKPVIAQVGSYGTTGPTWSVLIGNGYNSPNGTAALLEFDVATGKLYVHATDSTTSNGLAAPVAWLDAPTSGMSDIAYAGDLNGRMWAFTLSAPGTGSSSGTFTANTSSAGTSLFTAKDSSGNVQPITGGTIAGLNTKDSNSVWVFFGTGKYLTQTDISSTATQSWYGLKVQSSPSGSTVTTSGRSTSLVQRQIIAEQAATSSLLALRAVTAMPATNDMSGKNGWYIDLLSPLPNGVSNPTAQGERMVFPNQFQGNLLLGTTRIPQPSTTSDPCNPAGGGWIMAVDPFTGTGPSTNFFDASGDGLVNSSDSITIGGQQVPAAGVGFKSLPNAPIFIGVDMLVSFDNGSTSTLKTNGSSGGYSRVSWQEVVNP